MPTNELTTAFFQRFAECLVFLAIGVGLVIWLYLRKEFPRLAKLAWGFAFIALAVVNALTLEQLAHNIDSWFKITPLEFNSSLVVLRSVSELISRSVSGRWARA